MGNLPPNEPNPPVVAIGVLSERRWIAPWAVVFLLAGAAASADLTRHCPAVASTSIQSQIGWNIRGRDYGNRWRMESGELVAHRLRTVGRPVLAVHRC